MLGQRLWRFVQLRFLDNTLPSVVCTRDAAPAQRPPMATNAETVAAYILDKQEPISAMKLHKLLYYCQAWHLVWDAEKLFDNRIEAWRDGPVVPDIYQDHRGMYRINKKLMLDRWSQLEELEDHQAASIDAVLHLYGDMPAWKLRERTHVEGPWLEARGDLAPDERGDTEISTQAMYEYYLARVSRA